MTVSLINGVGKTGYSYAKEWNYTSFKSLIKINLKYIRNLNVILETVKTTRGKHF